jgi:glycosyltransferase involved in cell wall biosynthesis
MTPAHNYLFNFAASFSSGGFKRLEEYARWFDAQGGASFVVHPRCTDLRERFPRNRYHVACQSRLERLFADGRYIERLVAETGRPDFHYSYGIPLYRRTGRVDWFHLSNVLPVIAWTAPLTPTDRLKFALLGRRILGGLRFADVVSAESSSSLHAITGVGDRGFVSVNGSDDELEQLRHPSAMEREELAVVVGTYRYKALGDALKLFDMLRQENPALTLEIYGNPDWVPAEVARAPRVMVRGSVPRDVLIGRLRRARFYLSTTRVENSFNAASEGVFLAERSYVSDIGPHRELLEGMPVRRVRIAGVELELLHVVGRELRPLHLLTWDQVVRGMLARATRALEVNAT